MEKEQIIKALECCSKDDCDNCLNNFGNCYSNLAKYALTLIKELTVELDAMRGAANSYKMHNERLTEENERLKTATEEAVRSFTRLETRYKFECKRADTVKANTVREMQDNLNELLHTIPTVYNSHFRKLVSQVVERMLKENV